MSDSPPPQDLGALSEHAPALAAVVAQVASDVALVIDTEGVIRSVDIAIQCASALARAHELDVIHRITSVLRVVGGGQEG